MDKFGIFKLLNSFLSANGTETPIGDTAKSGADNIINTLLNSLKTSGASTSSQNSADKSVAKNPTPQTIKPLQQSMLSTMNSHEQFIKRVKEKSPQPTK